MENSVDRVNDEGRRAVDVTADIFHRTCGVASALKKALLC